MEKISREQCHRVRKSCRKSRQGCRNCKLRKVKCDEGKPRCQRCTCYGVSCDYEKSVSDLQAFVQDCPHWTVQSPEPVAIQSYASAACRAPLFRFASDSIFGLDEQSMSLFRRFRSRTRYSFGGDKIAGVFDNVILMFSSSYDFLMHAVLATTAMHDRYLGHAPEARRMMPETYHWSRCTSLFNKKLSQPIQPQDRDVLWATASFLGTIVFSSTEAQTPDEAWPLKPWEPSDLDWLRMCDGKMALWSLTNPLRPESIFHQLSEDYAEMFSPLPKAGVDGMPIRLRRLCELDESSTLGTSPYFAAAHIIARLERLGPQTACLKVALSFIHHAQTRFKGLLHNKDPIALLLLATWYSQIRHMVWWVEHRASIEYQSIVCYTERFHHSNKNVQDFLLTMDRTAEWTRKRL